MHRVLNEIRVRASDFAAERHCRASTDEHFCDALAVAVVLEFTGPGDLIVDPFAGFGTTLDVAVRLGRRALGIELQPDRAEIIRQRVPASEVRIDDARRAVTSIPDDIALCLTSPPYMTATGHPQDPLTGYRVCGGDYQRYLAELGRLFADLGSHMCRNGRIVINVADQVMSNHVTPLVDDLRDAVSRHLRFDRAIPVLWDPQLAALPNDTCLAFSPDRRVP